jgi:hypothetical protein
MKALALAALLLAACPLAHAVAPLRTWTNSEGATIRARYIETTPDGVIIERDDGRRFVLPLERLSPADRAFVTKADNDAFAAAAPAAARPAAAGTVVLELSAARAADFKIRLLGVKREAESRGNLPAPWTVISWNADTLLEIARDPTPGVGGSPAVEVSVLSGPPGFMFSMWKPFECLAGETFEVSFEYWSDRATSVAVINRGSAFASASETEVGVSSAKPQTARKIFRADRDGQFVIDIKTFTPADASFSLRDLKVLRLASTP